MSSQEPSAVDLLEDGQLQFSVSDTGVGLPIEKMDQIFSAFFTTKPQGSDMGLAISRSIGVAWRTVVGKRQQWRGSNFSFHPSDPGQGVIALGCLRHLFVP